MFKSFAKFMEEDMSAAPSMNAPMPTDPDSKKDNKDDKDSGKYNDMKVAWSEIGINRKDGEKALKHGEPIISFSPIHDPKNSFKPAGPMPIQYIDDDHGKIMYDLMNKEKFQDKKGNKYNGEVKNSKIYLGKTKSKHRKNPTWSDISLEPFIKQAEKGGGAGEMTGGMPGVPTGPPIGGLT